MMHNEKQGDACAPPIAFVQRLKEDLGPEMSERIIRTFHQPGPRGIRFNPLKKPPNETRTLLIDMGITITPLPWCEDAAVISRNDAQRILSHQLWDEGAFHIQSLPSIAASIVLDPQPGERVLDICAAPGGKTSHIAAMMNNTGEIIANDRSRIRCHRLRALLEKLSAQAIVRCSDGANIGHRQPDSFDRVLVDVPCSGEGRFTCLDPKTYKDWTVNKTRRLASMQKSLLHSAIAAVRPGGVIVYSTCTFNRTENEAVLERALKRYGDGPTGIEFDTIETAIEPTFPALDVSNSQGSVLRSIPDPDGNEIAQAMEGFFVAKLRRRTRDN